MFVVVSSQSLNSLDGEDSDTDAPDDDNDDADDVVTRCRQTDVDDNTPAQVAAVAFVLRA